MENLVDLPPQSDPTDPLYQHQWYLKNTGQNGGKPKLDLNTAAAWAQGITGKNVTTAIMDDGVDYMHPDLIHNYNARASYDFSSNDPYPYPRYTDDWFNSHGTRCAGEVSGARDNGVCGTGVAYDSMVAGIRMLDQPYMTDLIEANSMGHEPNLIDIYSASWGPTDDGRTVDGPRNATMRAIVRGVNEVKWKAMQFLMGFDLLGFFRVDMALVTSTFGPLAMVVKMMIVIVMVMQPLCGPSASIRPSILVKMRIMMNPVHPLWLQLLVMELKIPILES